MNLDRKALAGFIKEIEDSRTRQKGETDFQRDVFKRAREKHFDVKALRIVLQRRAMEPGKRDEQDYNVHAYELALGAKKDAIEAMERGASAREAAKAHNLPRASVTALKPGSKNGNFEPDHDKSTGEIRDGLIRDASLEMEAEFDRELRDALNLAPDSAPVNAGGNTPPAEAPETATKSSKHGVFDLPAKCEAPGPQDNPEIGAEASIVVATADSSGPPTPLPPSEAAIGRRSSPKPISDEQAMDAMLAAHARLQASKRERECV
jgi:uncharacterized protein (UPF0335 family)